MATGQVRQWNFFVILLLFGDLQGGSLLNLANPVQNPHFFGEFSQKFPERSLCTCRSPKTDFAFWRNFAQKKKQRCAGVKILGEKKFQHEDTGMVKVI
jgi:hypothetical protein